MIAWSTSSVLTSTLDRAASLGLRVRLLPHPRFERSGRDLTVTVPVPVTTAALGGPMDVTTLSGSRLTVKVPPGTQVLMDDGTVHDLVVPGQRAVVAKGGSGGRGNTRFKSATRQAPRLAERGLAG